jgi:hypothetical protein
VMPRADNSEIIEMKWYERKVKMYRRAILKVYFIKC